MNTLETKSEIIDWLYKLEDESILNAILALKDKETNKIDAQLVDAISIDEAREKSKQFIKNLPWKNQKL